MFSNFCIFFFENEPKFNRIFFSNIKKFARIIFKKFFEFFFSTNFFFYKFFLVKIFIMNFSWQKFFFLQKYFCENFFHIIFANLFCILCLRNNVFCEIFYSKFRLLRIFLFCNFGLRKKKLQIFFAIFFSAMIVNTKVENVSFLKKS